MQHLDFFGCPRPILAVAMNRVSDVNLAVAVLQAGAFPSISSFNYYRNGSLDHSWLGDELDRFRDLTGGSTRVLVSLASGDFLSQRLQSLLLDRGFRFVELFNWEHDGGLWRRLKAQISYLETWHDLKVVFKIHRARDAVDLELPTIVFKGNEGAGRTVPEAGSLEENFRYLREARPSLSIIPSGGISTPEQVKYFLDRGALAVGIGTLFAAAEESCVSRETKLRMIKATADDIRRFGKFSHHGLVFGSVGQDDDNNTRSLMRGIAQPTSGSIFAGRGIDHVKEILPAREIVQNLTALLPVEGSPTG